MLSTNKLNPYILTSIAAHILCASFLLLQKGKLQNVDADINEMVTIVLHQSVKNFAAPAVVAAPKVKVAAEPTDQSSSDVVKQTETQTSLLQTASAEVGQVGRLAKTSEEVYIAELKYDLEKRKKYPVMAKKMGHTGRVTIKFEIDRRGEIIYSEILVPAKHPSLNESVQKLLLETKTFKPFPEEISRTTWKFILPVEFKL